MLNFRVLYSHPDNSCSCRQALIIASNPQAAVDRVRDFFGCVVVWSVYVECSGWK